MEEREAADRIGERSVIREAGSERCYADAFEDGGRGLQAKDCWWFPEAGKSKETDSLLPPPGMNPAFPTSKL